MSETDHFEVGIATLSTDGISDYASNSPYKVNGVAIPVNTIVNGGQNVDHFFPEEVLQGAGELLEGKPWKLHDYVVENRFERCRC